MSRLSNYCENELTKLLIDSTEGIRWTSRSKLFKGPSKIDVLGIQKEKIYIIELELSREDPVNNIAKIYYNYEKEKQNYSKDMIWFFHIFSRKFSKGDKKHIAEFIGNKISVEYNNLSYISMNLDIQPVSENEVTDSILNECFEPIRYLAVEIVNKIKN